MAPRLPKASDFPTYTLSIIPPPASHPPTNVLLLLHGTGDTHLPFAKLGQQLNLSETACISIQAPTPLPLGLGGFHWGDDLIMDEAGDGGIELDSGFEKVIEVVLEKIIKEGLVEKCGYRPRDVVLFGFGGGGCVALGVASKAEELGGVVSIGGFLPSKSRLPTINGKKFGTPVLVCKALRESAVTEAEAKRLKDAFAAVEIVEWKKRGDGMPSSRDEMLPIMKFLARRLRSVRGVPEDAVELS